MKIDKIDKNLKVETKIEQDGIVFYDTRKEPFEYYGLYCPKTEKPFKRMPYDVAKNTSQGVLNLIGNTAGGRLRFQTDSEYVAISAKMKSGVCLMSHMAFCGSTGFDMYVNDYGVYSYVKTFMPPTGVNGASELEENGGFEGIHHFESKKMRDITINLPLYNNLDEVYIGLEEGATIEAGKKYRFPKPVVAYGSSITQGGCASRPGNAYTNILSRMLDIDVYNLGFSGSAKGEDAMADYIASLDMKLFIYDYDHNAPNDVRLKETHEKMFKKIREKNPDLPIVIVSRPQWDYSEQRELRREVIKTTYKNALDSGDKNVYFVNGSEFFEGYGNDATVDGCHPNDLGFMCMAKKLYEVILQIL